MFVAIHYVILKLYHAHLFSRFCFFFYPNLSKSFKNVRKSKYCDLKEILSKLCKNYIYRFILDLIYYNF